MEIHDGNLNSWSANFEKGELEIVKVEIQVINWLESNDGNNFHIKDAEVKIGDSECGAVVDPVKSQISTVTCGAPVKGNKVTITRSGLLAFCGIKVFATRGSEAPA